MIMTLSLFLVSWQATNTYSIGILIVSYDIVYFSALTSRFETGSRGPRLAPTQGKINTIEMSNISFILSSIALKLQFKSRHWVLIKLIDDYAEEVPILAFSARDIGAFMKSNNLY